MCIQLAINEIFNNINEHASASEIKYIAKKEGNTFEIIIYDNGCGFKKTLHTKTEREALFNAIELGMSGTCDETRGLGIRSLNILLLNRKIKGEFTIISSDSYHYTTLNQNNTRKIIQEILPFSIKGSAIILRINENLYSDYEVIAEEMITASKL